MRQKLTLEPITRDELRLRNQLKVGAGAAGLILSAVALVFILNSGEQRGYLTGFHWRKALVVDSAQVSGTVNMIDFPLMVHMIDEDLKSESHGGKVNYKTGNDIRFTRSDGASLLMHRIDSYNPKKGEVLAWVNLDTLFTDKPTPIFMYFGSKQDIADANVSIASRKMQGHYLTGGTHKNRDQNTAFDKDWLETEFRNQSSPETFFVTGKTEPLDATIPITYDYLKATPKAGELVLIEWATNYEDDNDYFIVERSLDAVNFKEIGKAGGGGHADYKLRYNYPDTDLLDTEVYYRIRQVNDNGNYSYSDLISVNFGENTESIKTVSVSPNPFNDEFVATIESPESGSVEIQLYNGSGELIHQELKTVGPGNNEYAFHDAANLEDGVYVLSIQGADKKLKVITLTKKGD